MGMPPSLKFTITRRKCSPTAKAKWQIAVPARFNGGKKGWLYFETKAAAEVERGQLLDLAAGRADSGVNSGRALGLSSAQALQAVDAFAALASATERGLGVTGLTLVRCVEIALAQPCVAGSSILLRELIDHYVEEKRFEWSDAYASNVDNYCFWLASAFDGLRAAEVSSVALRDWMKARFASAVYFNSAFGVYSGLWNWAVKHEFVVLSPLCKISKMKQVKRDVVDVLSLYEVGRLFEACGDWRVKEGHPMAEESGTVDNNYLLDCGDCVLPFAVQLFAGLRPAEFERICWEDVLLEQGLIRVLPSVSKTGRLRLVPIADVLRGLLEAVPLSGRAGKLAPKNWKRKRYVVVKAAGLEGRHDVLRHSFASYHLAMWRDIGLLREAMGHEHGSKMTFDHYLTAVLPSEAPRYWALNIKVLTK